MYFQRYVRPTPYILLDKGVIDLPLPEDELALSVAE